MRAGRDDGTSVGDCWGAIRRAGGQIGGRVDMGTKSGGGQKTHTSGRGCVGVRGIRRGAGKPDEKEEGIGFISYNLWNSHNGGLYLALRRTEQANIDMGILQEMNITSGVYMRSLAIFCMVDIDTLSQR